MLRVLGLGRRICLDGAGRERTRIAYIGQKECLPEILRKNKGSDDVQMVFLGKLQYAGKSLVGRAESDLFMHGTCDEGRMYNRR